ncbi:hypothetical protein [Lysinibacillus xylanilyticus]|uniref:hypothetical protein n=1 Tax=Lysinibacillus xylanilyticus TaxID=582475 RepID=UPI003D08F7D0
MKWLIVVETERLLGISVTDVTLERASRVKRLIGHPQEALRESEASAAKRSVGTEINLRFAEELYFIF